MKGFRAVFIGAPERLFWSVFFLAFVSGASVSENARAGFASRFSLSLGEEYNDNIFFAEEKKHDFITHINPALTVFYAHPSEPTPIFTGIAGTTGQLFKRDSELNNIGDNAFFIGGYTYAYSPRLTFHLADHLQWSGRTRTTGQDPWDASQFPTLPTTLPPSGRPEPPPPSLKVGSFIAVGDALRNNFSARGRYLYSPTVTFTGRYATGYTKFFEQGGTDMFHSIGARGVYQWRQQHNLHIGYATTLIDPRTGSSNIIHTFNIGDDFFTGRRIQLFPTLTVSFSTGISLNIGSRGPRVANNTTLTVIKLWDTASLSTGVRKGLTSSFGVAGPSDTTTVFSDFNIRLTEFLVGRAGVDFSLFDTDRVNFKTLEAYAGLQYWITGWLSSHFRYSFRRRDSGRGASATILGTGRRIESNSVFLVFSAHFDIWPALGFARIPPPVLPATPSVP